MNITRAKLKETLRTIVNEESEYQTFFKTALEKAGKSIPEMSEEEKKAFFNKIDAAWDAKGEKNEALVGNQHKLDIDGDGEIDASDLAALRAGKKKEEGVNEYNVNKKFGSKYDIGAGQFPTGTVFWNRAEDEDGDYKKLAHIADNGKITFYDKSLPSNVKKHIEDYAKIKTESINEGKFKVDDLVYNKRTKTVGIVRIGDDRYGEVKTDADGNVNVDELEKYNPIKFKHQTKAKVAPSTEKEVNTRGLFNPFKNESVNEDVNFTNGKYRFYSKNSIGYLTYNGKLLSKGDYDFEGGDSYWMSHSSWKGQKAFDTGNDVIKYFKSKNITTESVNEGVRISLFDPNKNKILKSLSVDRNYKEAETEVETLNKRLSTSEKNKGYYWKITTIGESVNESKDDFVARYGKSNILLKKGYKHHTADELEALYDKVGKLVKGLNVKDVNVVFESEVTEGKKVFKVNPGIGKAKYSISSHDGKKTHKDGSDFYDIEIFNNKVDLEKGIKKYTSNGFVKESVNETSVRVGLKLRTYLNGRSDIVDYELVKPNYYNAVKGGKTNLFKVINSTHSKIKVGSTEDFSTDDVKAQLKAGVMTVLKESVNEEIAVGKMVKVDNPHWEGALGKKGPFRRKVKMIDGDNVFFTDGSNSSMKYVKESVESTINESLVPVDKKAVDAFFNKKPFEGKNLNSDGKVLKTVGVGSQEMYIHTPKGVKMVGKVTGQYAQSVVQYVNKNHKSDLV